MAINNMALSFRSALALVAYELPIQVAATERTAGTKKGKIKLFKCFHCFTRIRLQFMGSIYGYLIWIYINEKSLSKIPIYLSLVHI